MSNVLIDRDRVVESMCLTWRHDFGMDKPEGCDFCSGMTDKERELMGKLFDHHFAPALSAVTAERERLESILIRTTTRHSAQQRKNRAVGKKLDECLSEGIAMLEAERDQLRAEVERLREAACPAQKADEISTSEQQPLLPTASDLEAVLDECEAFRDLSDVAHGWYEALECMSRLKKERIQ